MAVLKASVNLVSSELPISQVFGKIITLSGFCREFSLGEEIDGEDSDGSFDWNHEWELSVKFGRTV